LTQHTSNKDVKSMQHLINQFWWSRTGYLYKMITSLSDTFSCLWAVVERSALGIHYFTTCIFASQQPQWQKVALQNQCIVV